MCRSMVDIQSVTAEIRRRKNLESNHHNRFTALFRDHPGEPVPEENF